VTGSREAGRVALSMSPPYSTALRVNGSSRSLLLELWSPSGLHATVELSVSLSPAMDAGAGSTSAILKLRPLGWTVQQPLWEETDTLRP
jgi:hypothetical protein